MRVGPINEAHACANASEFAAQYASASAADFDIRQLMADLEQEKERVVAAEQQLTEARHLLALVRDFFGDSGDCWFASGEHGHILGDTPDTDREDFVRRANAHVAALAGGATPIAVARGSADVVELRARIEALEAAAAAQRYAALEEHCEDLARANGLETERDWYRAAMNHQVGLVSDLRLLPMSAAPPAPGVYLVRQQWPVEAGRELYAGVQFVVRKYVGAEDGWASRSGYDQGWMAVPTLRGLSESELL